MNPQPSPVHIGVIVCNPIQGCLDDHSSWYGFWGMRVVCEMRPQKLLEACKGAPYISESIIVHRGASSTGTGWDSIGTNRVRTLHGKHKSRNETEHD